MVKEKILHIFEWGGSSMIEDRGEIFPSLEVDAGHPAVRTLMNSHESDSKRSSSCRCFTNCNRWRLVW